MMNAIPMRVTLTEADHIVISQAMTQAMELDGVFITDFRDGAIPLSAQSMRKLRTVIGWQKTRVAVMARLTHAGDLAAEHATARIAVDLARDEARAIVHAVLASVDFDDDRIAGAFADLGEGARDAPGSEAMKVRDFLARRNAARLASLRKLYTAAGIEFTSTSMSSLPP